MIWQQYQLLPTEHVTRFIVTSLVTRPFPPPIFVFDEVNMEGRTWRRLQHVSYVTVYLEASPRLNCHMSGSNDTG